MLTEHHSNSLKDSVLSALCGIASVATAKLLGVVWIGQGFKAMLLGACGAFGGYMIKLLLDYITKQIKKHKFKKSIR